MDTATAVAVSLYRSGETVPAIIEATGLTEHQIAAAVAAAGTVYVADRHDPVTPPGAAGLIAWGMQHPTARMQRLADQARAALADLQQAQRREQAVEEAEDRVQQAERTLAEARQALRAAKGTGTGASAPARPGPDRPDKAEAALIRSWAREHGHQVAPVGLVPRHVVEAYRADHAA